MEKKRKRTILFFIISIIIILSIIVVTFLETENKNNTSSQEIQQSQKNKKGSEKSKKIKEDKVIKPAPTKVCAVPDNYKKQAKEQGKLTTFSYETKMTDDSGKIVKKEATVYLPYGYDENKKYDFVYLCHGSGANKNTFLGNEKEPKEFKYIVDNMIEKGEIKPIIIVTPTYTKEYKDYYEKLDGMTDEIVNELIPAVEKKYNSYATDTTPDGLIKARGHRAIGGFSMGGCTTWRAFKRHLDYFKYYMPMSMPMYYYKDGYNKVQNDKTAPSLAQAVQKSSYAPTDYAIYAASGNHDFMNEATEKVVEKLQEYPEQFQITTTNFKEGNLMYTSFYGYHRYYYSNPYMYNGLRRFFGENK
ncbi:Enterochelin esterase [Lachnospiraceae bacterium C7]|nr:Enterochelin esterase [Lachnospiraceae bacterium C7]